MEIFGESQIVEQPSYMHVGYLATQTFRPHFPILSVGLLLLFVGALISGELKYAEYRKKSAELSPKTRKRRKLGIRIAVAGFFIAFLAIFPFGKSTWDHPTSITESRTEAIARDIVDYICEMKKIGKSVEIPLDVRYVKDLLGEKYKSYDWNEEDGWYKQMKLKGEEIHKRKIYYVISAGRDGKFDTKDDITYPETDDDLKTLFYIYSDAEHEIWRSEQAQTRENSKED